MKSQSAMIVLSAVAVLVFIWAANQQGKSANTNLDADDQSAYMGYAKNLALTNFHYDGNDRNRMPLYPALMSLFYRKGMPDAEFFKIGKKVGIGIALMGLMLVFYLLYRVADFFDALTGALVAAFTVFVYKAPYFQADVLFYFFHFLLFILLLALMNNLKILTAAAAGLVAGVAHLTKAAVLPAVLLAAIMLLLRGGYEIGDMRKTSPDKEGVNNSWQKIILTHLGALVAMIVCFLTIVYPYISTSKAIYGSYFYNDNFYCLWSDSFPEAQAEILRAQNAPGQGVTDDVEPPAMQKYFRTHSPRQMLHRITGGIYNLWMITGPSFGYSEFLSFMILTVILLFAQNKKLYLLVRPEGSHPAALIFVFAYFSGYILLYAWYTLITMGSRFILSLFLPALFLCTKALSRAQKHDFSIYLFGRKISASAISLVILFWLSVYVFCVLPFYTMASGGGK